MNATPEQLDILFPERQAMAERLNLHSSLRAHFVPLPTAPLTEAQRDALFEPQRRVRALRDIVQVTQTVEVAS